MGNLADNNLIVIFAIEDALNEIAKQRGQTLAEMSLAWLLHDDAVTSVLAGASKPQQIIDNIGALKNTDFSDEELKAIDEISMQ